MCNLTLGKKLFSAAPLLLPLLLILAPPVTPWSRAEEPAAEKAAPKAASDERPASKAEVEAEAGKPQGAEQEVQLPTDRSPEPAQVQAAEPVQEETAEEKLIGPSGTFEQGVKDDALVIESKPEGARVFVDGEEKGKTPLSLKDLAEGPHEVVLYLTGFGAYRQSVGGKGGKIVVDLRTDKGLGIGLVTISTNPPDARVDVNGQKAGLSPLEIPLEAGRHTIHVSKAGFKEADIAVDVPRDAKKSVDVKLEPKEGSLLVISNPAGADVTLNGKPAGKTWEPLAVKDVSPGVYAVRVFKQGFRPWEKNDVVVRSDRGTTVLAALLPERDYSWVRLHSKPIGARVWLDGQEIGVAGEDGLAFKTSKGAHSVRLEVNPAVSPGYQPLQVSITLSEDEIDFKASPFALPPIDENYTHALQLIERGQKEEALGFLDRVPPQHPSYAQARLTVVDVFRDLGRVRDIPNELATLLGRPELQNNAAINLAMGYWSLVAARDVPDTEATGMLTKGVEALDRAAQGVDRFPSDKRDGVALKTQYFTGMVAEILFDLTGDKKHVKKGVQAWELFFARLDQSPKALEETWIEKARRHRQSLEYLAKKLGG